MMSVFNLFMELKRYFVNEAQTLIFLSNCLFEFDLQNECIVPKYAVDMIIKKAKGGNE